MTVSAGQVIVSLDTVLLERRINRVEAGAGAIVVCNEDEINSYPLRSGGADRIVANLAGCRGVDISPVTGHSVSTNRPNQDVQQWDNQNPGQHVWTISGDSTSPRGVAIDRSGNVYVTDFLFGVRKYNSAQVLQWSQRVAESGDPDVNFLAVKGCALTNNESHIWVVDSGRSSCYKLRTSDGAPVDSFELEDPPEEFALGHDITIPSNGKMYTGGSPLTIIEGAKVQRYSANGDFELEWGSPGTGNGQFTRIVGLASSPNHNVVFVYDTFLDPGNTGRIQAFDGDGTFLWARDAGAPIGAHPNTAGDITFGFGSQTEWFRYPTELTAQRVSAGTPDGGFSVPSENFYEGNIIRPNTVSDMQAAIEAVAPSYVNATYAEPFNWEPSHRSNLYTVAVDFTKDDWDKPTKEALEGVAIRPDEYSEIDLCLNVLELSFPV